MITTAATCPQWSLLEYPELELSNNLAENAMRPVGLGRKNWIHLGSKEAGPRVAAIIPIVETWRRLNIRVRDYLASVLPWLSRFSDPSSLPRGRNLTVPIRRGILTCPHGPYGI
jgi:Transposase IS66 family